MRAYKCDRCGSYYVLDDKERQNREYGIVLHPACTFMSAVDLCNVCYEKLQVWLGEYGEIIDEGR